MKLHHFPEEFQQLITVVANDKHISESAVERDYYIVMMLKALADSPYAEQCVFKGGTSLSKCYPGCRKQAIHTNGKQHHPFPFGMVLFAILLSVPTLAARRIVVRRGMPCIRKRRRGGSRD